MDINNFSLNETIGVASCNVIFLQNALCEHFGYNGALWSLFHEFWYYVTFPFFMVAFWGKQNTFVTRFVSIGIFAIILTTLQHFQFIGPNVFMYAGVWLLGAFAAIQNKKLLHLSTFSSAALFLLSLVVWRAFSPKGDALTHDPLTLKTLFDYIPALMFANLLVSLKCNPNLSPPPLGALSNKLAGFSFSLYCIHTPIINCFGAFLVYHFNSDYPMTKVNSWALFLAIGCIALCILVSFVFATITEKNTDKIRRFVYKKLALKVSQ